MLEFLRAPGWFDLDIGPVKSGKTSELTRKLNVLRDCGYWRDGEVLVFKHPLDDPVQPDRAGEHRAIPIETPEDIFKLIKPETKVIAVAGLSHISEPDVVALVDASVRSGRIVIGSALNLAANGQPYNQMAGLCALVDSVRLTKAICNHIGCFDRKANRSVFSGGKYLPYCSHHARFQGSPPVSEGAKGSLDLVVSTMYSGKSEAIDIAATRNQVAGVPYIIFKTRADDRDGIKNPELFSEGRVVLHSGKKLKATNIDSADNIRAYLSNYPHVRDIMIDEGQFVPDLYDLALELIPQGYKILVTGLLRGFNRQRFGDISKLICLADTIEIPPAFCPGGCYDLATDNQRMKRMGDLVGPASYNDPLKAVGGKDTGSVSYFYEPRCRRHWELIDEPPLKYELPRLTA